MAAPPDGATARGAGDLTSIGRARAPTLKASVALGMEYSRRAGRLPVDRTAEREAEFARVARAFAVTAKRSVGGHVAAAPSRAMVGRGAVDLAVAALPAPVRVLGGGCYGDYEVCKTDCIQYGNQATYDKAKHGKCLNCCEARLYQCKNTAPDGCGLRDDPPCCIYDLGDCLGLGCCKPGDTEPPCRGQEIPDDQREEPPRSLGPVPVHGVFALREGVTAPDPRWFGKDCLECQDKCNKIKNEADKGCLKLPFPRARDLCLLLNERILQICMDHCWDREKGRCPW